MLYCYKSLFQRLNGAREKHREIGGKHLATVRLHRKIKKLFFKSMVEYGKINKQMYSEEGTDSNWKLVLREGIRLTSTAKGQTC